MTKQETMFAMIRKWERSGKAKATFAREHDIPLPTFYNWCRRYEEHQTTTTTPSFIELPFLSQPLSDADGHSGEPRLRVEFPDGMCITIY